LKQLYPNKYVAPTFSRFNGCKGSALVHVRKFIDSMDPYAGNGDLCLQEFSKSLDDRTYTWYTTLPPGSVRSWDDMVEMFYGKYFQVEEKITLVNLHSTKQRNGEDLLGYIHRFRDISLDCYANYEESELVGFCIDFYKRLTSLGSLNFYKRLERQHFQLSHILRRLEKRKICHKSWLYLLEIANEGGLPRRSLESHQLQYHA
jgi:hypothetical protein